MTSKAKPTTEPDPVTSIRIPSPLTPSVPTSSPDRRDVALSLRPMRSPARRTLHLCVSLLSTLFFANVPTAQLLPGLPKPTTIPPVEEAITASVAQVKEGEIVLDITPIPSVYLYKDKLRVSVPQARNLKLGRVIFPATQQIDDETFGKVHVFRGAQQIRIPYQGAGKANLVLDLMGCHAEAKICYPPHRISLAIDAPATGKQRQPIASTPDKSVQSTSIQTNSTLIVVKTGKELDAALKSVRGKYAMVDVWATWCTPCKQMEKTTFADADVNALLKDQFVKIKVDVSKPGADSAALMKRFGLAGPPGFAFYAKNGDEIQGGRLMGYVPPERFLAHLKLVSS